MARLADAAGISEAALLDDAIVRAIPFGHDTDTTAAIVGGLAGLKWGVPEGRVALLAARPRVLQPGRSAESALWSSLPPTGP